MKSVKVTVTKVTDETCQGWVECELLDAFGKRHIFIDKSPIFEADAKSWFADLPRAGAIRCKIVEERADLVIIDTELPDHAESNEGKTRFAVLPRLINRN